MLDNKLAPGPKGKHVLVVNAGNRSYKNKYWKFNMGMNTFNAVRRSVFKSSIVTVMMEKMGMTLRESLVALEKMEESVHWTFSESEFIIYDRMTLAILIDILVNEAFDFNEQFKNALINGIVSLIIVKGAKRLVASTVDELNDHLGLEGEDRHSQFIIEGKTGTLEVVGETSSNS